MPAAHGPSALMKWPVALALVITTICAVFAVFWALIAGLWAFSTRDYGQFLVIVAIASLAIWTPVLGFKYARQDRFHLALAVMAPVLVLGLVLLLALSSR